MNQYLHQNKTLATRSIWVASVVVPIAVGIITNPSFPKIDVGFDTHFLATISASINFVVGILLIAGYLFVRQGKYDLHQKAMLSAFVLSIVFLLCYIIYHTTSPTTYHCEKSPVNKSLYLILLYSHIGISSIIVPLSCFTVFRGLLDDREQHRKIAKITLPLWLYVAFTGVIVYWMISPCYPA
ncbi:MAG: DUF420 domain-containing protein [Bacteroidia bacterium]